MKQYNSNLYEPRDWQFCKNLFLYLYRTCRKETLDNLIDTVLEGNQSEAVICTVKYCSTQVVIFVLAELLGTGNRTLGPDVQRTCQAT